LQNSRTAVASRGRKKTTTDDEENIEGGRAEAKK